MPIVSEAQRKAMYAASEGRSTLGIPKAVGKEFVAAGPASARLPQHKAPPKKHAAKPLGDEF
jgi:hypothetical protein